MRAEARASAYTHSLPHPHTKEQSLTFLKCRHVAATWQQALLSRKEFFKKDFAVQEFCFF